MQFFDKLPSIKHICSYIININNSASPLRKVGRGEEVPNVDARVVIGSLHGEGFAAASLTVGENAYVVAIDDGRDQIIQFCKYLTKTTMPIF